MHTRNGFTLIEIAIVLVVIGLVVGGVLVGRDLIKNSDMNYIITQIGKYNTAANSFRTKYNDLPGDSSRIVQTMGYAGGNATDNYTSSCMAFVGLDNTLTCNGDGNGTIGWGGPTDLDVLDYEGLLFWQQLSLAKLIDAGNLTPRTPSITAPWILPGFNVPTSKISDNAAFSMFHLCITSGGAFYHSHCAPTFFYGGKDQENNMNYLGLNMYPTISALDAYNIDKKIDNGLPGTGTVTTVPPGGNYEDTCSSSTNMNTATYTVTTPGITCALMFQANF